MRMTHNVHIKVWSENKKIRNYLEQIGQYWNGS